MRRFFVTFVVVAAAAAGAGWAATADEIAAEEQGLDPASARHEPIAEPGTRTVELGMAFDVLLVPDSTNDRIMAFDPVTGALVDADFIPADPTNLSTPKSAIYKADGTGFLVSDQLEDVVQEYDLNGSYVGVFAPAGGANTSIVDNMRSIAYHPDTGELLVPVASGANANSVARFDSSGNYLGNFVANGAGGLDSPWHIVFDAGEAYVPASISDAVHSYDRTTGASTGTLLPVDSFAISAAWASNGNLLVANWSGTQEGILEIQPDGTLVDTYFPAPINGPRGVFELPSGNLLVADGDGVHEITRSNTYVDAKITGVSCHTITLAEGVIPVELQRFTVR